MDDLVGLALVASSAPVQQPEEKKRKVDQILVGAAGASYVMNGMVKDGAAALETIRDIQENHGLSKTYDKCRFFLFLFFFGFVFVV
jgi:hypothetical protein